MDVSGAGATLRLDPVLGRMPQSGLEVVCDRASELATRQLVPREVPGAVPMLLIDPPTFPKGIMSLSLASVAAALSPSVDAEIIDLNFRGWPSLCSSGELDRFAAFGLKVSAQSLKTAILVTDALRERLPLAPIVWGGEYPTLRPEICAQYADCVVAGRFEPIADAFVGDLRSGKLKARYAHAGPWNAALIRVPRLDKLDRTAQYSASMGAPLETSIGCPHACSFCMVHTMQPALSARPLEAVRADLAAHPRRMVSVVDYNLGADRSRVLDIARVIGASGCDGWTAEMCIEALADHEVLDALRRSRCRIVYCGLETLSKGALASIAKRQNQVEQYREIIERAQSYGIEVATGLILGLEGSPIETLEETLDFFEEVGVIYVKLTFLTYNPGTKVHKVMRRRGYLVSEDDGQFDGLHLTYVPKGVDAEELHRFVGTAVRRIYSWGAIWRRSAHVRGTVRRLAFVLHARCYGWSYFEWLRQGGPGRGSSSDEGLLTRSVVRSRSARVLESFLSVAYRLDGVRARRRTGLA